MTRFARAKGSKASNERVFEEATSWDEMKQQLFEKKKELEEDQKRKDVFEKRNANFKAFLEEREKENEKNATWAEFPGAPSSSDVNQKKTDKKRDTSLIKLQNAPIQEQKDTTNNVESDSDEPPEESSSKKEISEPTIKKMKTKSKKLLKITLDQERKVKESNSDPQKIVNQSRKRKSSEKGEDVSKKLKKPNNTDKLKKKQKPNDNQKTKVVKENLTEKDLKKIEKKKQKRIKQLEKKKKVKAELKKQKEEGTKTKENNEMEGSETHTETQNPPKSVDESSTNKIGPTYPKKPNNNSNFANKQKKKDRDNGEHPRKKPIQPHKIFMNGREFEVEYVDGFPVKKEDAVRIKKLRREMISRGLPRSEINVALKLERRKAEKAFTREKKKVCFQCRKSGHNLSECPEIDKDEVAQTAATGICFKCGSTEHTHFECKVVRGEEFKYATCFICKEQGHISRQCPDNARGLYPEGGACKVCGDVTHMKKNCPKYQAQQQKLEDSLKIETFGNRNPDALQEQNETGIHTPRKRVNKIVKF